MAGISRPKILTYQLNIAAGAWSSRFVPATGKSWEVHSVVCTRAATIKRSFDANRDGTFETGVEVASSADASGVEFHGFKFELDEYSGLEVKNNDTTNTMHVVLIGLEIT